MVLRCARFACARARLKTDTSSTNTISRKVVKKIVHGTIPKGNLGYDQYNVPGGTVAVGPTFVAFL